MTPTLRRQRNRRKKRQQVIMRTVKTIETPDFELLPIVFNPIELHSDFRIIWLNLPRLTMSTLFFKIFQKLVRGIILRIQVPKISNHSPASPLLRSWTIKAPSPDLSSIGVVSGPKRFFQCFPIWYTESLTQGKQLLHLQGNRQECEQLQCSWRNRIFCPILKSIESFSSRLRLWYSKVNNKGGVTLGFCKMESVSDAFDTQSELVESHAMWYIKDRSLQLCLLRWQAAKAMAGWPVDCDWGVLRSMIRSWSICFLGFELPSGF